MKKLITIVALSLGLAACGERPGGAPPVNENGQVLGREELIKLNEKNGNLYFLNTGEKDDYYGIVIDGKTGCEYIAKSSVLYPRTGTDCFPVYPQGGLVVDNTKRMEVTLPPVSAL